MSSLDALFEAARAVQAKAHTPYSRFKVGAALRTPGGRIFAGCNVENASYGLTICAERTAVAKAVSDGERAFRAIAVVGPHDEQPCSPCGSCRQVLYEFGPELLVVTPGGPGAPPRTDRIADLLPGAFGPSQLLPGEGL